MVNFNPINQNKVERTNTPYDVKVSVDTFILVAKLSEEQQEELFDRIVFHQNSVFQDRYYHYSRRINNSITIKTFPRNPYTRIHYNTMLIFAKHPASIQIPYSILEILQQNSWKVKRVDIAFDFTNNTPFSTFPNRLIMKSHGNVKILQQNQNDKDWKAEYVGSLNSRIEAKACCYDRNEKENDLKTGIEHDFPLRFEVRLYPRLNEYNFLTKIDHGWIETKLRKFIFIPDIETLPLNKWDKRKLYKVQEDYDYWKVIKPLKQKEIKRIVKAHRVPFEELYSSCKETLFSFLEMPLIRLDTPTQYNEQLFHELF